MVRYGAHVSAMSSTVMPAQGISPNASGETRLRVIPCRWRVTYVWLRASERVATSA